MAAPLSNLMNGACVTAYDATVDYFPAKVRQADSTSMMLYTYHNSYKVLNDTLNNQVIVAYQCGTPKPSGLSFTPNVTIEVPAKDVTIADMTSVTYLELLGQRQAIKYTTDVGVAGYIVSPCIQAEIAANLTTAPQDVSALTLDKQLALLNSTSVTFSYPGGNATKANNSVVFTVTSDNASFHHSEYLHFIGFFFNEEENANNLTAIIAQNYQCLASEAQTVGSKLPAVQVATISYSAPSSFNGNTASYSYQIPLGNYSDAGGVPVAPPADAKATKTAKGVTYTLTSQSALLSLIADADIILDMTFADTGNITSFYSSFGLSDSDASKYKFIHNKQVWSFDRRVSSQGATESFEAAIPEEHVVLADYIAMIQPNALPKSDYTPTFWRNVYTDPTESIIAATCSDPKAPLPLPTVACAGLAATTSSTGTASSPTAAAAPTAPNSIPTWAIALGALGSILLVAVAAIGVAQCFVIRNRGLARRGRMVAPPTTSSQRDPDGPFAPPTSAFATNAAPLPAYEKPLAELAKEPWPAQA
ncbi:hypothetical protein HK101_011746 [Irineochytrium annulatum]|nr:hypothetical protein HK101_011746 [Irineochytrium annulatum]